MEYQHKHVYDGVFSRNNKVGTRVEDYREIFRGSSSCSIPMLDVPELNEGKIFVDARRSRIDYNNIFGGFGDDADFAVSHEELFKKPKEGKNSTPSHQVRPSAESRQRSAKSEYSNVSEEKKRSKPEASLQFDGVKRFNVSYNKTNSGGKNGTNGTMHIAQLQAAPGYTCLIDESSPTKQMTEGVKAAHNGLNVSYPKVNISKRVEGGQMQRKVVSGPQPSEPVKSSSPIHTEIKKKVSRHRSISDDLSFEDFEIAVGPYSSRKPLHSRSMSNIVDNKGGSHKFTYSNVGISRVDNSEGAAGSQLPAFFEEEGDVNSAAASSAAAVRKAIEEAQAKIKLAKELMEKRKGFQNRVKVGFNNGLKVDKREIKTAEIEARETAGKQGNSVSSFSSSSQNVAIERSHETLNFQGEMKPSLATETVLETYHQEPKSTQVDHKVVEAEDGNRQDFSGFALVREERASTLDFIQVDHTNNLPSPNENDLTEDIRTKENIDMPKDYGLGESLKDGKLEKELNAVAGALKWGISQLNKLFGQEYHCSSSNEETVQCAHEPDQAHQTTAVFNVHEKSKSQLKTFVEENEVLQELKENMEEIEVLQELKENTYDKGILKEHSNHLETEMKQEEIYNQVEVQDNLEEFHLQDEEGLVNMQKEQTENEMEHKGTWEEVKEEINQEENKEKEYVELENEDTCDKLDDVHMLEVVKNEHKVLLDKEESTIMLPADGKTQGKEDLNKKLIDADDKSKEIPLDVDNENIMDEIQWQNGNGSVHNKATKSVECQNKQEQDCYSEENYKKETLALREEEFKRFGGYSRKEVTNGSSCDFLNSNELDNRLGQNGAAIGQRLLEHAEENEELLEEDSHMNGIDTGSDKTCEKTGSETEQLEIHCKIEDDLNFEAFLQPSASLDKVSRATQDACNLDTDDLSMSNGIYDNRETLEKVVVTLMELSTKENGKTAEEAEICYAPEETVKGPETVVKATKMDEDSKDAQGFLGLDEMQKSVNRADNLANVKNGVCLGNPDFNSEDNQMENYVTEYHGVRDKDFEDMPCVSDKDEEANNPEVCFNIEENENNLVSPPRERQLDDEIESTNVEEVTSKPEERAKEVEKPHISSNHEDNENFCESAQKESGVDDAIDAEASQQTCLSVDEAKTNRILHEEEANQSGYVKEENHQANLTIKQEAEDALQEEVDLEKKYHRKKEEAKVRKMEKEKERMVVERAIREARERAFAEARERAEKDAVARAAAEAHQRLKAENQKRLEKVSSGSYDKSSTEKASMINKQKAERAAVERATAEARERALEKAMSEKAGLKQKNQGEKASGVSGDNNSRSNDKHFKDLCQSSSNNDAPCSTETFGGTNGESVIRCKATMERIQRTQERAAKALAEKNKRDLLAQKEQEERNRLAEILDAEVKRWSSGKERNLRALLSTLQYILGPESGWRPMSLTELISSTAVRKAYRKATLFVHPDKLQQRGASIQQKYTCEKVFDLLKEAWNKFSGEER